MKNSKPKKKPATNGSAPTDTIPWSGAVAEGKEIKVRLKAAERDKLRLGELAHKVVHPIYREETFAKFAAALGIDEDTLGHYRTTYRAWKDFLPPGQISRPSQYSKNLQRSPIAPNSLRPSRK